MDSFLSIIIICVISSISSSTSIQLFSEEGIIHRLGEGFYHIKSDIPREYFINFKARQSMGVNVLGGIYVIVINQMPGLLRFINPETRGRSPSAKGF